jgi:guanine nucleotide-binding protein alpha-1 subunit
MAGISFLGAIDRVASRDYIPGNGASCEITVHFTWGHGLAIDDILHARIQTMGVAELLFEVPLHGRTTTWHLYDVCGVRGQRHTWMPYFDDTNAIIFLAPVSAFDQVCTSRESSSSLRKHDDTANFGQYLDEDPIVNRIDDSLQVFTAICSNQLLKHIHLILILSKSRLPPHTSSPWALVHNM